MINNKKNRWIGLLGGTFDPIHEGHLHIAHTAHKAMKLDTVHFIPCAEPVHRDTPQASSTDRLRMLELATQHFPFMQVNPIELERKEPSYTIDTLRALRRSHPDDGLILLLGSDAFNHLNTWQQADKLFEFAHLAVILRPGHPLDLPTWQQQILKAHHTEDLDTLKAKRHGSLYLLKPTPHHAEATLIRSQFAAKAIAEGMPLPSAVKQYILAHGLYDEP